MSALLDQVELLPAARRPRPTARREALVILVFYGLYTVVRDLHATVGGFVQSTHNALKLVAIERHLGIFAEQGLQHLVIGWRGFIEFWDSYYGTIHFIAVIFVLVVLYFRYPSRYMMWRNTLALTTGLALIGFAFFPVLPPRLLPASYHFVDTLKTVGGVWNFSHGLIAEASNQYAAMPSLHTAWSTWCALAMIPLIRPWWGKALAGLYPVATVFCIVITANHYFLDAAAGVLTVAVAFAMARLLTGRRLVIRRAVAGSAIAGLASTAMTPPATHDH